MSDSKSRDRQQFPTYDVGGWVHWPEHEVESAHLKRLLGDAQEGASFVSECFLAASKILPGDDESWLNEWRGLAHNIAMRAHLSTAKGHFTTSRSEWLRAVNYFRTAAAFLDPRDSRLAELCGLAESSATSFVELLRPFGEFVEIPFGNRMLRGYFIRSPGAPAKSPAVLAIGHGRDTKEDLLVRFQSHAIARGLSLLVVDLPSNAVWFLGEDGVPGDSLQDALRCCLDYLLSRDDIDRGRIALLGDGLGGSDATRAAATDSRWSAVVCDAGFWDELQLQYAKGSLQDRDANVERINDIMLGARIKCPCLVLIGEDDYAEVKELVSLYERCRARGVPIELKLFSGEETGAAHRQIDNPTLGRHFIFDWLKERLLIGESEGCLDPTFGLLKEVVADLQIVNPSRST